MNTVTAIVPIKQNSQRLPHKVFLDFFGIPLYRVMLDKLESVNEISEIIVNTDSETVMSECAGKYSKVVLVERPVQLCGDEVPMNSIIEYELGSNKNEHFLQTHVTNPLLKCETISQAIRLYFEQRDRFDSLTGVIPIYKRVWNSSFEPVNHQNNKMLQTQDLEPVLIENSNIFIFSKISFYAAGKSRIGLKPFPFYMNCIESVDIDYPEDFELAKFYYHRYYHHE
jgi:CMP-N-acetylneuraminic acid synthetase